MSYKCSECGFRSDLSGFFHKEKGGLLGFEKCICEGCSAYQPTAREKWLLPRILMTPMMIGIVALSHRSEYNFASVALLLMIIGALISLPLRIWIHEAGHAFTARLVGTQVRQVSIGRGPVSRRWVVGDVIFDIHRYAFAGGLTWHSPVRGKFQRVRQALILLAGPGANLLGAIGCFTLGYAMGLAGDIGLPITALCSGVGLSQLLMAVSNLWPSKSHYEGYASDGQQLLDLMKRPSEPAPSEFASIMDRFFNVSRLRALRRFDAVVAEAENGLWDSPLKLHFAGALLDALSHSSGDRAVVEYYLSHEAQLQENTIVPEDAERSRPWVQANVAWSAIKLGDPDFAELADALSAAAAMAAPDQPVFICTRGASLIWAGRVDEGLALMGTAIRQIERCLDKADLCQALSRGWRLKGDVLQADGFEALSRHLATTAP